MAIQRTFVMVKPDGVQRGLVGKVVQRFEEKGLKIVAMKMLRINQALARKHYAEHVKKPFFKELTDFIQRHLGENFRWQIWDDSLEFGEPHLRFRNLILLDFEKAKQRFRIELRRR